MTFDCPHCGQSLDCDEDMAGEVVDCPACRRDLTIPNPDRRGWATVFRLEGMGKIHYMRIDESLECFVSLCNRDSAANDQGIRFLDISETDPRVCKMCLRRLHPDRYKSESAKPPRPKLGKLSVSYEDANNRLQDAVRQAYPMFEAWGMRRDSLEEYWHTVYHKNREAGTVEIRFVHKGIIGPKQRDSAKRAFYAIINESEKDAPRITDYDEAERVVNVLAEALRFAGYELSENGKWYRVAK